MEALNNYLIIRKDEAANATPSGLILPPYTGSSSDGNVGAPYTGVITSIGSEVKGSYKVGDHVAFSDLSAPYVLDDGGGTVLILADEDIVAVITEE